MLAFNLSTPRHTTAGRVTTSQSAPNTSVRAALVTKRVQFNGRRSDRSRVITKASAAAEADPFANKYPSWDSIYMQLTGKYNLRSVTPDEAAIMIDEGKAVLLDVRLAEDHAESRPQGSVSCPAFRVIKAEDGAGMQRMLKGLLMRANGVNPTEAHPDFPARSAAAAGSDKIVILACEAGGTPFATPNFPTGKASRSLKACWKLMHSNALPSERVVHLSGGVLSWFREGLPMERRVAKEECDYQSKE